MKRITSDCTGVYQRERRTYEKADYAELVQSLKSNFDGFALLDKIEADARYVLTAHSIDRPDFPTGGKDADVWTRAYSFMQEKAKKFPIVGDAWELLMALESVRKCIAEANIKQAVCHAVRAGTVYEKMRVRMIEPLTMSGRKSRDGGRIGGRKSRRVDPETTKKAFRELIDLGEPVDSAARKVARKTRQTVRNVYRHLAR